MYEDKTYMPTKNVSRMNFKCKSEMISIKEFNRIRKQTDGCFTPHMLIAIIFTDLKVFHQKDIFKKSSLFETVLQ